MTAYTKTLWVDEVLESAERYTIKEDAGGAFKDDMQIILKTTVTTPGTAIDAAGLNKIEQGIHDAQDAADAALANLSNRQGGSATDWNTAGTTNYALTTAKMQCGAASLDAGGVVTFPVAFSQKPIVFLTTGQGDAAYFSILTLSATQFSVAQTSGTGAKVVFWIAIGPA